MGQKSSNKGLGRDLDCYTKCQLSNHSFLCIPSAGTALPSTKNGKAYSIGKIIDWGALLIVSRV